MEDGQHTHNLAPGGESNGGAKIGRILEQKRKEKGLSLSEVEKATKIRKRYIDGLERELTADSMPHLSLAALTAAMTPADKRSVVELQAAALADDKLRRHVADKTIVKTIFVPNRILNLIVR